MSSPLLPTLLPGQTGILNYRQAVVAVRGSGVLDAAIAENLPTVTGEAPSTTCAIYDCAALNEIGQSATLLATIDANSSVSDLGLAFENGLTLVPGAWHYRDTWPGRASLPNGARPTAMRRGSSRAP